MRRGKYAARSQPTFVGDHVQMNMSPQLSDADHGFKVN
jgi:hypothetical protein